MLKQKNRIRLNKEFDRAFKTGQSFYSKIIGIKMVDNHGENSRFGILINTKVSKKAVERNRIRRQLREIIKDSLVDLKDDKDFIFIVLPLILNKKREEIEEALKSGFKKIKAYKK